MLTMRGNHSVTSVIEIIMRWSGTPAARFGSIVMILSVVPSKLVYILLAMIGTHIFLLIAAFVSLKHHVAGEFETKNWSLHFREQPEFCSSGRRADSNLVWTRLHQTLLLAEVRRRWTTVGGAASQAKGLLDLFFVIVNQVIFRRVVALVQRVLRRSCRFVQNSSFVTSICTLGAIAA